MAKGKRAKRALKDPVLRKAAKQGRIETAHGVYRYIGRATHRGESNDTARLYQMRRASDD